jgi:hypothetical protein
MTAVRQQPEVVIGECGNRDDTDHSKIIVVPGCRRVNP